MPRNYNAPTVSTEWASSRQTDMAVAVAIHAIADRTRSADAIWEAPTAAWPLYTSDAAAEDASVNLGGRLPITP